MGNNATHTNDETTITTNTNITTPIDPNNPLTAVWRKGETEDRSISTWIFTMSLIYTQPTSRNNLYLGGKDDAKSLPRLQQRNVHRILNVTPAKEAGITAGVPNFFEGKSGPGGHKIQYKRIPVYDASTSDMLSYADEIVNFISNGLHHGSVLVHCQRGVSRSATAIVMFLVR